MTDFEKSFKNLKITEENLENLESDILNALKKQGTLNLKKDKKIEENFLYGILLKLSSKEKIKFKTKDSFSFFLTEEGEEICKTKSPEFFLYEEVKKQEKYQKNKANKISLGNALKINLLKIEGEFLKIKGENLKDFTKESLVKIKENKEIKEEEIKSLLKRKLVKKNKEKEFFIEKGLNFNLKVENQITEISIKNISEQMNLKKYNFNAKGQLKMKGSLHPLLKMKSEFRKIFLKMGFKEMPTNKFVESSFWNFDALFQPQLHPSREMHDTFFVNSKTAFIQKNYLEKVKSTHLGESVETRGYKTFNENECYKNVLRTHTTASSTRFLYNLSKNKINKGKFFSIDKVFRNESVDSTHLAEFCQIEGLIIDKNLGIGHLKGILTEFFKNIGLTDVKFKPAYNPYTEPSMEIFAYSKELKKWMEVGNSGIFRPEMLIPMGFDKDIRVIAWGLSLERPAMIKYGVGNIRDLVGHKVDLKFIEETGFVLF